MTQPKPVVGSRKRLITSLLGIFCCTVAYGATSPITACDRTANLQSLDVRVDDLSAANLDHMIADHGDQSDATIDAMPAPGLSEAPILKLAPRVAVILQDVFSAVAVETSSLAPAEQTLAIETTPAGKSALSPVVGETSQVDSPAPSDPDSDIGKLDTVPSLRRQMFRTDI